MIDTKIVLFFSLDCGEGLLEKKFVGVGSKVKGTLLIRKLTVGGFMGLLSTKNSFLGSKEHRF